MYLLAEYYEGYFYYRKRLGLFKDKLSAVQVAEKLSNKKGVKVFIAEAKLTKDARDCMVMLFPTGNGLYAVRAAPSIMLVDDDDRATNEDKFKKAKRRRKRHNFAVV